MKVLILAGGLGSRLSEETSLKPKPMVEIGGKPILWHIMKIYSYYGFNEFIILCGYKGYLIKEYFINYFYHKSDITISLNNNTVTIHDQRAEPWNITLIDTGEVTMTGGRLKRVKEFIKNEEAFCFTYGDGLSDINITELIDFHKSKNKLATISVVYPPGRFGAVEINNNSVTKFTEKPKGDGSLINGGFFVLSPKVIDFIDDDSTIWEGKPLDTLAQINQMSAFIHNGFWQPMDTLRDKEYLENLWNSGNSPWKVW